MDVREILEICERIQVAVTEVQVACQDVTEECEKCKEYLEDVVDKI
jgi:hypothetical protein